METNDIARRFNAIQADLPANPIVDELQDCFEAAMNRIAALESQLADRDAEIERLKKREQEYCQKRCFGHGESDVTNWVTEAAYQKLEAEIERLRAELVLRKNYADQCRAQDATIHRLKLELDACERAVREARDGV